MLPWIRAYVKSISDNNPYRVIELLFVFVDAVFVAPRSEELGIATY